MKKLNTANIAKGVAKILLAASDAFLTFTAAKKALKKKYPPAYSWSNIAGRMVITGSTPDTQFKKHK